MKLRDLLLTVQNLPESDYKTSMLAKFESLTAEQLDGELDALDVSVLMQYRLLSFK